MDKIDLKVFETDLDSNISSYDLENKYKNVLTTNQLITLVLQYKRYQLADRLCMGNGSIFRCLFQTKEMTIDKIRHHLDYYIENVIKQHNAEIEKKNHDSDFENDEKDDTFTLTTKNVLHDAIYTQRLDVVQYLVQNMNDNVLQEHLTSECWLTNNEGEEWESMERYTPIMIACHVQNIDILKFIIQQHHRLNIGLNNYNSVEFFKVCPFYIACCRNKNPKVEVARLLFEESHEKKIIIKQSGDDDEEYDQDNPNHIDVNRGEDYAFHSGSYYHQPVLIISSRLGNLDMVKFLVEECQATIDVRISDDYTGWYTPLSSALSNDHLHVVRYLLSKGDTWSKYFKNGYDQYYKISRDLLSHGTLAMLQDCIQENEFKDFNSIVIPCSSQYVGARNSRPLSYSAFTGRIEIFQYLCSISNDLQRDIFDCNFLAMTTLEILKWFIEKYPSIDLKQHPSVLNKSLAQEIGGQMPLEKIKFLVDHLHLDLKNHSVDDWKNSALARVCSNFNNKSETTRIDYIKYLLSQGLSLYQKNKNGDSPLLTIIKYFNVQESLDCLTDDKISSCINMDNIEGESIYVYLAKNHRLELLVQLYQYNEGKKSTR